VSSQKGSNPHNLEEKAILSATQTTNSQIQKAILILNLIWKKEFCYWFYLYWKKTWIAVSLSSDVGYCYAHVSTSNLCSVWDAFWAMSVLTRPILLHIWTCVTVLLTSYLYGLHFDHSRRQFIVVIFIQIQHTIGVNINQTEKALVNMTT
jgi:hypothetical protein